MSEHAGNANTSDLTISFSVALSGTGGLVVAYSFNEGTGTTLPMQRPRAHRDDLRRGLDLPGEYGDALSFDGVNDWVTVNETAALDMTSGITLEAWVNPTAITAWRRC